MTKLAHALARIDAVHAEDPASLDARPRELVYAERMTHWLSILAPGASDALRIAVRAQHLARWRSPRTAYPEGRVGYLQWRKAAGERHAADVSAILVEVGLPAETIERVARLVTKKDRTHDAESQLLEDCACLVFLELDYAEFAGKHGDDGKVVDVVKKTWAKMSPAAHERARTIPLPERAGALVARALS